MSRQVRVIKSWAHYRVGQLLEPIGAIHRNNLIRDGFVELVEPEAVKQMVEPVSVAVAIDVIDEQDSPGLESESKPDLGLGPPSKRKRGRPRRSKAKVLNG